MKKKGSPALSVAFGERVVMRWYGLMIDDGSWVGDNRYASPEGVLLDHPDAKELEEQGRRLSITVAGHCYGRVVKTWADPSLDLEQTRSWVEMMDGSRVVVIRESEFVEQFAQYGGRATPFLLKELDRASAEAMEPECGIVYLTVGGVAIEGAPILGITAYDEGTDDFLFFEHPEEYHAGLMFLAYAGMSERDQVQVRSALRKWSGRDDLTPTEVWYHNARKDQ